MPNQDDKRLHLVSQALACNSSIRSADHAAAASWAWERLAKQLIPLIGESGFCALYARAVRLALPQFDWFAPAASIPSTASLLQNLQENLMSVEATASAKASQVLLDTFTSLLSTLIGDVLTTRILNSAWADASAEKNPQEKKQ